MKTLSFRLTMPNKGSWDGRWTGNDNKYYIVRSFKNEIADKILEGATKQPIYKGIFIREHVGFTNPIKNYYYNFGDGWGANVAVEQIDSREASKRRRVSSGFCGYDWMVASIIHHGDIYNSQQIKEMEA